MDILYVLLFIIKIFGFVLLGVLAAAIVIILLFLFLPVKYKLFFEKHDDIQVKVMINCLFIWKYIFEYSKGKNVYCFKIFGISLKNNRKKKRVGALKTKRVYKSSAEETKEVHKEENELKGVDLEERKSKAENVKNDKPKEERKKESTARKFYKKASFIYDYLGKKEIIIPIINLFKSVFKCIKPYDGEIYLKIGTGNPADTGYIVGFLSILRCVISYKTQIIGDFNKEAFETKVNLKGRITAFGLIFPFISFVLKKPIRKIIFLAIKD